MKNISVDYSVHPTFEMYQYIHDVISTWCFSFFSFYSILFHLHVCYPW